MSPFVDGGFATPRFLLGFTLSAGSADCRFRETPRCFARFPFAHRPAAMRGAAYCLPSTVYLSSPPASGADYNLAHSIPREKPQSPDQIGTLRYPLHRAVRPVLHLVSFRVRQLGAALFFRELARGVEFFRPAQAWIPAFAGMTDNYAGMGRRSSPRKRGSPLQRSVAREASK